MCSHYFNDVYRYGPVSLDSEPRDTSLITSFTLQNDVTPSKAKTDVNCHCIHFPRAFKTVTLSISYIGKVY